MSDTEDVCDQPGHVAVSNNGELWWCTTCAKLARRPALSPAVPVPADMVAQIAARNEAAHAELVALCEGKRWTMQVPARETLDSDLIIGASLADVPYLLSELAAAHRERDDRAEVIAAMDRELEERTAERDAALAQLAKVRELAESWIAQPFTLRGVTRIAGHEVLAAAGGNPGDTP
jgi:hypothetical protein